MHKHQTALLIGRFQPFHCGHLYLLETGLELADTLVIAIGSANKSKETDNPLDFENRKKIIQAVIDELNIGGRILGIVASNDYPSDDYWYNEIITSTPAFTQVLIGRNEWTERVFREKGFDPVVTGEINRDLYEGKSIRQAIRSGKPWEDSVPAFLLPHYKKHKVIERIKTT